MSSDFKFGLKYVIAIAIAAFLARLYIDYREKQKAAAA